MFKENEIIGIQDYRIEEAITPAVVILEVAGHIFVEMGDKIAAIDYDSPVRKPLPGFEAAVAERIIARNKTAVDAGKRPWQEGKDLKILFTDLK